MKMNLKSRFTGVLLSLGIFIPSITNGQSEKAVIKKYLSKLPDHQIVKTPQKYIMTAVYTNRDLLLEFYR